MYSYTKKRKFTKRKMIATLTCLLAVSVSFLTYEYYKGGKAADTAVFKEEELPVLALPNSESTKISKPFAVEASVALEYFDGKEASVKNITEFEGVYRGNQGMDYVYQGEAFDVVACVGGVVKDIKEDSIFGKSVTIDSQDLSITYQSLSDIALKKGDQVNKGDILAKAGKNIYNKDLGNHLHIVMEYKNKIQDPKKLYEKQLSELK